MSWPGIPRAAACARKKKMQVRDHREGGVVWRLGTDISGLCSSSAGRGGGGEGEGEGSPPTCHPSPTWVVCTHQSLSRCDQCEKSLCSP